MTRIHVQYFRFLGNTLRLDLGYSMANFPATVYELVGRALPWTIGLVGIATLHIFHGGQSLRRLAGLVSNAQVAQSDDTAIDDIYFGAAGAV